MNATGSPPTGSAHGGGAAGDTAQVAAVLRYCKGNGVKVVPRGAGTSLSGGALPLEDGVLLGLGKFKRILDIDVANRCVVAQPGVANLGYLPCRAGVWALLRARSVEPDRLLDRRQCRGKFRRRALPEIWADHQQCHRRGIRHDRGRGDPARRQVFRRRRAMICSAFSSAPRGCSGWSRRSPCGCCRRRPAPARC